jgi:pimeloyl-ACP methyl ester carboxylesterase
VKPASWRWLAAVAAIVLAPAELRADTLTVSVRGRALFLTHVSAAPPAERVPVLFLPGDGGFRGFAVTIARRMAAAGYEVYGLDTREYLEAFTGATVLAPRQAGADVAAIATAIGRGDRRARVALVGWSEGAALAIAAAATTPDAFAGVVVFGVPEQGVLAWRLRDTLASLAGREASEPAFDVAPFLSSFGRLPLVMIQASHDPFTPPERAKALFDRVPAPKRLEFIDARNHRFDGNTQQFFDTLVHGLGWVQTGADVTAARRQAARR